MIGYGAILAVVAVRMGWAQFGARHSNKLIS